MKSSAKIITALFFLFLLTCCDKDKNSIEPDKYNVISPENPVIKGDRLFGINISSSKLGFESSFNKATEAGIELVELNIPWTSIESEEGKYTDPNGNFAATAFYGANNIKVGLSLALINTVKWEIPVYLKNVDVSSNEFLTAFTNMLDWTLKSFPDNVDISYLSIGNEVDVVLESDKDWEDYTSFYKNAAEYVNLNYPDIKVGVKTTVMGGLYGTEKTRIQLINQHSNVVMLNYYPQDWQFKVLAPEIVHSHFGDIVTWFPGKNIWLTEVGYQSGNELCASSETKQAHFYHNLFAAWDTYNNQIKVVVIDWLHDQTPELINEWKNYYGNTPALVEYLSTLGLRNYDDSDKAAWIQLLAETKPRNWQ